MFKFKTIKTDCCCRTALAMGADMTNTVCLSKGDVWHIGEQVGDLSLLDNFQKFKQIIDFILEKEKVRPEVIVCDLHPGYASVEYAQELAQRFSSEILKIQHHKAHVAAAAYEHNLKDYVGIACDGLGYGEDGNIWGGEVFNVNGNKFERVGSLEEQKQLGGDSAAIFPKKMLFGILSKFMDKDELLKFYNQDEINIYLKQIEMDYNVFTTTSTGRILDSISSLLGVCEKRTFDGEPAIKLEQFASTEYYDLYPFIEKKDGRFILNTTELFKFIVNNLDKDKHKLAATAQIYIAKGLLEIAKKYDKPIVFTGGVAHNKMISGFMRENGVLLNKDIPCGDAGICYGQAYLANISQN